MCLIKRRESEINHCIQSIRKNITIRAIVKTLKRDLNNYRSDLVPIASKS